MRIVLENEEVRVLFDPETGAIVSLFDKRQQADLLTGPMASGLFRVIAPDGACLSNHFDAEKATASMEGNTATFTYETPNLVATVRLELIGPAILTTLQLQNRSVLTLEEIQFPRLTGLKPIPNGMITLPNFGRRRFDPLGPELSGDRRHAEQYLAKMTARYPERMVTAWCDYASDRHGIALEARHTDFSIVDFMVAKTVNKKTEPVARTLDLVAAHPRRVMPGESWESPPMRLFVHEGD